MRAAASLTISRAIFSSTVPAPAARVSARCLSTDVARRHCGGDAALRPGRRRALPDRRRGKHGHRPRCETERAEQAREPAADDDDVVGGVEPSGLVRSNISSSLSVTPAPDQVGGRNDGGVLVTVPSSVGAFSS